MQVLHTALRVGAEKPFTVIHMSDTHLTYADMRDGERKVKLGEDRQRYFPQAEEVLRETCALSKKLGAPILHTGDLTDFVSFANLERVKRFLDENDCFFAAGNHEFSLYVGEAWEDEAYRNRSLGLVQSYFKNDIRMSSRVINGVNFVALDDGYYLFEDAQTEFVKNEAKKGLPMVLMLHNPIHEPKLYEAVMFRREEYGLHPVENPCAYLTGTPDELRACYEPMRNRQQAPDEATKRAIDYFRAEPLIRAVLAGHLHVNFEGELVPGVPQFMVSTTDVRVITVE